MLVFLPLVPHVLEWRPILELVLNPNLRREFHSELFVPSFSFTKSTKNTLDLASSKNKILPAILASTLRSRTCSECCIAYHIWYQNFQRDFSFLRGSPIGFFNPAIPTGIFPQSRNPDVFYRLIQIPVIFLKSALPQQKRSSKFRSRFPHSRPSRPKH